MEQDDTPEFFQECDNDFPTQQHYGKDHNFEFAKQTKNNQHVVHIGIIVVVLTIFLGLTNVPKCLVNCVENTSLNEKDKEQKKDVLNYLKQKNTFNTPQILERFLEYKDICQDLEIFTRDIKQRQQPKKNGVDQQEEEINYKSEMDVHNYMNDIEVRSSGVGNEEETSNLDFEDNSGNDSSGQGDCAKINNFKNKKSKYSIKTTNNKNGFNKYNKSTKAKSQKNQKKDLNLNKKNSTAEPIIYLFALVFIYLLLKAASDINQHYKSQNKNDKRLRRCSLQSYAQSHRPDRRASKELALKQKQQQQQQQRLKTLTRCPSQDQPNYQLPQVLQQQQHLRDVSSQNSSELKQQTTPGTPPVCHDISYSSNWQLLRQHTTTQSFDNSDILKTTSGNAELSSSRMARRCSVPAALSFQRQKVATASPLSFVNDPTNMNVSISRRSSIVASSLPLTVMDPNESLITETKRRVRMINRH